ncbi:MAG: hypothetical protein ACAI44_39095 [Candidatus Sericytochromatia bacterium]
MSSRMVCLPPPEPDHSALFNEFTAAINPLGLPMSCCEHKPAPQAPLAEKFQDLLGNVEAPQLYQLVGQIFRNEKFSALLFYHADQNPNGSFSAFELFTFSSTGLRLDRLVLAESSVLDNGPEATLIASESVQRSAKIEKNLTIQLQETRKVKPGEMASDPAERITQLNQTYQVDAETGKITLLKSP